MVPCPLTCLPLVLYSLTADPAGPAEKQSEGEDDSPTSEYRDILGLKFSSELYLLSRLYIFSLGHPPMFSHRHVTHFSPCLRCTTPQLMEGSPRSKKRKRDPGYFSVSTFRYYAVPGSDYTPLPIATRCCQLYSQKAANPGS